MPTTCDIEFENNLMKVVYAGTLLRGTVRLSFTNQKQVCGIYVRIYGFAFVQWKEGRRELTGDEIYINEQMYFVGEHGGEIQKMEAGTYNYTFQCMLPLELPTSVEGRYGHVRYSVRVVVDRPMWADKKFKVPFTVIRALNLSDFPSLREPVVVEKTEKIHPCYVFCCVSDPIKIMARTNAAGYTPGQVCQIEININNQSDVSIVRIIVELVKQITYYKRANSQSERWESIPMIRKSAAGCGERQQRSISMNIDVPRTRPSDSSSNLLKVKYLIRVIASTPMFCSEFKLNIPVTIGSNTAISDLPTQNIYPCAVSTDNVILQQPSVVQLPDEKTGPKITDGIDPPTYADVLHVNGGQFDDNFPAIKIAPALAQY